MREFSLEEKHFKKTMVSRGKNRHNQDPLVNSNDMMHGEGDGANSECGAEQDCGNDLQHQGDLLRQRLPGQMIGPAVAEDVDGQVGAEHGQGGDYSVDVDTGEN